MKWHQTFIQFEFAPNDIKMLSDYSMFTQITHNRVLICTCNGIKISSIMMNHDLAWYPMFDSLRFKWLDEACSELIKVMVCWLRAPIHYSKEQTSATFETQWCKIILWNCILKCHLKNGGQTSMWCCCCCCCCCCCWWWWWYFIHTDVWVTGEAWAYQCVKWMLPKVRNLICHC